HVSGRRLRGRRRRVSRDGRVRGGRRARGARPASRRGRALVTIRQRISLVATAVVVGAGALGAWLAPYDAGRQFSDYPYAPPMPMRVLHEGHLRVPFAYPLRLVDPLERRYQEDRSRPLTLRWFDGSLVHAEGTDPWFPLGSDSLGRDVWSRVVLGARIS